MLEDAIVGYVINQVKNDGETVITKTTSIEKITSITIDGETTKSITVATEGGENQTKILTVACGYRRDAD